jgi:2',3'-cyclic-nucleotide 2'-phosphodiesterase
MRILFFGDIVGRIGREAVSSLLPKLVKEYGIDFIIANGENASHGKGLTEKNYQEIIASGVNVITLGNHWHAKDQIDEYIDEADGLIRPLNLLSYTHGVGSAVYDCDGFEIRVTNLLGQAFMSETVASPFVSLSELVKNEPTAIHIVDFHADSTSEKQIMGYAFAGKVTALVGTHTHVQTNDARILEGGTAFISDIGMCGAYDSVIGFEKNSVMDKILFGKEGHFEIDDAAKPIVNAVVIDVDEETGKALAVFPLSYLEGKPLHA